MDTVFDLRNLKTVYQRKYYAVLTFFYALPVTDYSEMTKEDEVFWVFVLIQYNLSFIFIMQKYQTQENMIGILF